ncbi:MAG: hypothetical protein ACHQ4F_16750, partial [Candidatus Dormibacteria bacterium]
MPQPFDSVESVLQRSAEAVASDPGLLGQWPLADLALPLTSSTLALRVVVNQAALLLRAPIVARPALVEHILRSAGYRDGRLIGPLSTLRDRPDDVGAMREVARAAVDDMSGLVRDDPGYLEDWARGYRVRSGAGADRVNDLREILSEPRQPVGDVPLGKMLWERVQVGAWANRQDRTDLYLLASEVPGMVAAGIAAFQVQHPSYEEFVDQALTDLLDPDDLSSARLEALIVFLRLASDRRPFVHRGGREVDLRIEFPAILERLLSHVLQEPERRSYAAREPAVLRLCSRTVQE